nr:multidrug resistance-associated protein 1 [Parasteatoda tepidariorum]
MGFEQICRTQFWNSSISWDTEDPSVSKCFQNLILVIASCAVLWVVAPFEFIKICKTRINPSPWTCHSITKMVLKVALLLVCTLDFSIALYLYINNPEGGLDGIIRTSSYFITIVLTVIITLMCKNRGMRVSLALPSFWMISTITTLISIYSDIHVLDSEIWTSVVSLVDDSLSFTISLIQLILSTIPDRAAHPRAGEHRDNCPLEGSPLQSRLSFSWIIGLLRKSEENSLHQDHLIPLCSEQKSASVASQFKKMDSSYSSLQRTQFQGENMKQLNTKSLFGLLLKMSQKHIIIASIMEVIFIITYYLPVFILSVILDENSKEKKWHNYVYSIGLFLAILFSSLSNSQRKYFGLTGALRIKTTVVNAVFAKALKVSEMPQKIKNLITVDADNIFQGIFIMSDLWGSPIRLVLGIYILWVFVGASCFIGVLTAFCLIPINIIVEHCSLIYQKKANDKKHEMIEVLSECIRGMKILKMYAWEEFFLEKIIKLRREEIGKFRKTTGLRLAFKFLFLSSTSMVSLATITAYVLMEDNANVKTIFLSYFIIYLLKSPFQSLLHLFAYFVECLASIKKVQKFLESEELENLQILKDSDEHVAILKNASFSWYGSTKSCLQNFNMRVPKKSLIAVVGEMESDKSSLLRALLGEMKKEEGEAGVKDRIEFVTQDSWIQSMSLEKNILFLKEKNNDFYQKTLEACALMNDIESLPAGDETEVGQKGVHLSMEQRIKIDIARAIYQDADLYIFDHPFKNIDGFLSEHLYHRVVGRSGVLKEKARIFLTESEEFLPLVDSILFLKDGRLVEQGSHLQLKEKNGFFAEYMKRIHSNSIKERKPLDVQRNSTEDQIEFGRLNDVWCAAAVIPAKIEMQHALTNEGSHTSKVGVVLLFYQ